MLIGCVLGCESPPEPPPPPKATFQQKFTECFERKSKWRWQWEGSAEFLLSIKYAISLQTVHRLVHTGECLDQAMFFADEAKDMPEIEQLLESVRPRALSAQEIVQLLMDYHALTETCATD